MPNKTHPRRSPEPDDSARWLLWVTSGGVLALALAVVLIVSLVPAPSSPSSASSSSDSSAGIGQPAASLLELANLGVRHSQMPDFDLTDQRGNPLSLSQFAGRTVVLSFSDDECEDLCSLLAQDVIAADRDLGSLTAQVAFVSINANPYHPSVAAVKSWTDTHGLGSVNNFYFGTGSTSTLAAIAKKYGVPVALDASNNTVEHGAQLFFIDPQGRQAQVGSFGTGAASTALFGHAMAQLAVTLLPARVQAPIGGPTITSSGASSAQLGAVPAPAQLPTLGAPSVMVGTAPTAGKYEVINFWSSSCTACVHELPQLQAEFKKNGARVQFTGIDVSDSTGSGLAFATRAGVGYPLASDIGGNLAGQFKITGLPYTVILDSTGVVLVRHPGSFTAEQLDYVLNTFDPAPGAR